MHVHTLLSPALESPPPRKFTSKQQLQAIACVAHRSTLIGSHTHVLMLTLATLKCDIFPWVNTLSRTVAYDTHTRGFSDRKSLQGDVWE